MTVEEQTVIEPNAIPEFDHVNFDELNWHEDNEIPEEFAIFDLEKLSHGEGLEQLANSLEQNYPFYIKNYGISEKEMENIYNKAREFFKRPENEKIEMAHKTLPPIMRGYTPYGAGAYENSIVNGRAVNQYCKYAWGPSDNIFPDDEFNEIFTNYYNKINLASEGILDCIGEALDLKDNDQWVNLFDGEETVLHCQVYYPESPIGNQRMIPHSDASTVTLLNQLPSPNRHVGLLVKKGDEYVGVPPLRGTVVVMVGESLNSFTNSRIKPVIHAVTGPKSNAEKSERSSMPFFANPRYNLKMDCPKETIHEQFYTETEDMCFKVFSNNIHSKYNKIEQLRKQGD
jgi:isopenicillin N synthase-like dioxygenase